MALMGMAATAAYLLQGGRWSPSALSQVTTQTLSAEHEVHDELEYFGSLEKRFDWSLGMCSDCYKINRCAELSPNNYSDAKQACLCDGKGPYARKPCQVQCQGHGPEPQYLVKLMPCQRRACNTCSRSCGGGNYWQNPGTIANWMYSSDYTTGKTWDQEYCFCMRLNCMKECKGIDLFDRVANCADLPLAAPAEQHVIV